MGLFLNVTKYQIKRKNSEAKCKNLSIFFKPNNFKRLKNSVDFNVIILDKFTIVNKNDRTCLWLDKAIETD